MSEWNNSTSINRDSSKHPQELVSNELFGVALSYVCLSCVVILKLIVARNHIGLKSRCNHIGFKHRQHSLRIYQQPREGDKELARRAGQPASRKLRAIPLNFFFAA
jgi:hypothetical protein